MSGVGCHRRAFTLYEVVLAIAILLGAMVVMSKLIATGSRASIRAQLQTQAMLLCQSKLSEVIAGIEPLASVQGVPFDSSASGWIWSLEVAPGPREYLLELHVHVELPGEGTLPLAKTSLVRWLRDPQIFEAADETATAKSQVNAQPGA
jgi:general secretion pathway protein I